MLTKKRRKSETGAFPCRNFVINQSPLVNKSVSQCFCLSQQAWAGVIESHARGLSIFKYCFSYPKRYLRESFLRIKTIIHSIMQSLLSCIDSRRNSSLCFFSMTGYDLMLADPVTGLCNAGRLAQVFSLIGSFDWEPPLSISHLIVDSLS